MKTEAEASDADSSMVTEDAAGGKSGPTHWSKIDVKTLKVGESHLIWATENVLGCL